MIEVTDAVFELQRHIKTATIEKAALEKAEAPAQQLAERDATIEILQIGMSAMVAAESKLRNAKVQREKWQEVYDRCVVAKTEYEAVCLEEKKYRDHLAELEDAAARCRGRLGEHENNPLDMGQYPSGRRMREWNLTKRRLEKELDEANAGVRQHRAEQQDLAARFQAARNAFDRLSFQERQLKPPTPQPQIIAIGHRLEYPEGRLSGVR